MTETPQRVFVPSEPQVKLPQTKDLDLLSKQQLKAVVDFSNAFNNLFSVVNTTSPEAYQKYANTTGGMKVGGDITKGTIVDYLFLRDRVLFVSEKISRLKGDKATSLDIERKREENRKALVAARHEPRSVDSSNTEALLKIFQEQYTLVDKVKKQGNKTTLFSFISDLIPLAHPALAENKITSEMRTVSLARAEEVLEFVRNKFAPNHAVLKKGDRYQNTYNLWDVAHDPVIFARAKFKPIKN